jgi:hypothetical protein
MIEPAIALLAIAIGFGWACMVGCEIHDEEDKR